MNKNKIIAQASKQASKQLCHKSWAKSILFSGLIGFNFLTISDGYGAFTYIKNLAERNYNYVKETFIRSNKIAKLAENHPGFNYNSTKYTLLSIKDIHDRLDKFIIELTPEANKLKMNYFQLSNYILDQMAFSDKVTIDDLKNKLTLKKIAYELTENHPGFNPYSIECFLLNTKGNPDALFHFIDSWATEMNELGIYNEVFSNFLSTQPYGITIPELRDELERKKIAIKLTKNHPGFDPYHISYVLSHIQGPYNKLFTSIDIWATQMNRLGMTDYEFSKFISIQYWGINIKELGKRLTLAKRIYKLAKNYHSFSPYHLSYTLSCVSGSHNKILSFLKEWAPKFFKATGNKLTFPSFMNELTINYQTQNNRSMNFSILEKKVRNAAQIFEKHKNFAPYSMAMILSNKDWPPTQLLGFLNKYVPKMLEATGNDDIFYRFIDSLILNKPSITYSELERKVATAIKTIKKYKKFSPHSIAKLILYKDWHHTQLFGFLNKLKQKALEETCNENAFFDFIFYMIKNRPNITISELEKKVDTALQIFKELNKDFKQHNNFFHGMKRVILTIDDTNNQLPEFLSKWKQQMNEKVSYNKFYTNIANLAKPGITFPELEKELTKLANRSERELEESTINKLINIANDSEFKTREINLVYELLRFLRIRYTSVINEIKTRCLLPSLLEMTIKAILGTNGDPEYEETGEYEKTDEYTKNKIEFKSLPYKRQLELQLKYLLSMYEVKDVKDATDEQTNNQINNIWKMFNQLWVTTKVGDTTRAKRNWHHVILESAITAGAALVYYYYKEALKQHLPWLPF